MTGWVSAWAKRGNCACAARADKRGETNGFSPLANHPFSLMHRPEAGTAAPFLFLTRTAPKKYGGCCGSSVRAEVRTGQRENGCRLSETVYARVTARAGGRRCCLGFPAPPGVEAVALTVIRKAGKFNRGGNPMRVVLPFCPRTGRRVVPTSRGAIPLTLPPPRVKIPLCKKFLQRSYNKYEDRNNMPA